MVNTDIKKEPCKEYVEDGVWYDKHDWKEVVTNKKIQSLKCQKCGQRSTAKIAEDCKKSL